MAGIVYPVFGKYELAVEEARKTVILDPDFSFGYNVLAVNYLALNRLNEAEAALDRAAERKLAIPDYLVDRYNLAFLAGSRAGMEEQVLLSRGKSEVEDSLSNLDGFVSAYVGRLQTARERSRQAADLAQHAGHRERAALYEAGAAVREALFGQFARGHRARGGRPQAVHEPRGGVWTRVCVGTRLRFWAIAGARERARNTISGRYGCYLAAHRGAEAAAEFQKILDHRGIVLSDPIGAVARVQLGRAFAASGEVQKATLAYQDFLTLWKDADREIPILKQANAEYERWQALRPR